MLRHLIGMGIKKLGIKCRIEVSEESFPFRIELEWNDLRSYGIESVDMRIGYFGTATLEFAYLKVSKDPLNFP